MAPHSSTLAWRIPWMEEPGGLLSYGIAQSQTRLSDFTFTFHFHALEKEMATHSSVLVWRIPGTGEPGGLPSMGLHRVGHDWIDLAAAGLIHVDNNIQQQWWYITSTLRLFKKNNPVAFILDSLSPQLSHSGGSQLPYCQDTQASYGKGHVMRNWESSQ